MLIMSSKYITGQNLSLIYSAIRCDFSVRCFYFCKCFINFIFSTNFYFFNLFLSCEHFTCKIPHHVILNYQLKEIGGKDDFFGGKGTADTIKQVQQSTEKKKGFDWMNLIRPPNEEKDHWVISKLYLNAHLAVFNSRFVGK